MEADRLSRSIRSLRKRLKGPPGNPTPQEVHKLRTGARRMETLAAALLPADSKQAKQLVKALKPIRKAAGRVRDMDVLTANAITLTEPPRQDSLTRLVERLSTMRQQNTEQLLAEVERCRKSARRRLKRFAIKMEGALPDSHPGDDATPQQQCLMTAVTSRMQELSEWQPVNARNIHSYRLKVKELRSLMQLEQHADKAFLKALGRAKDEIGVWHDWQQLRQVAGEILDGRKDSALLKQIDAELARRLDKARAACIALRSRFLKPRNRAKGGLAML